MKEIILKFEYNNCCNNELKDYLLTLNGILEVSLDKTENTIYIKYNNDINLKVLILEIKSFINNINIPDIIAFDKCCNNTMSYDIIIKDLCCEYCLMSNIEELLFIEGINKASTYFDKSKKNIRISIEFNPNMINLNDIKRIEKNFNS